MAEYFGGTEKFHLPPTRQPPRRSRRERRMGLINGRLAGRCPMSNGIERHHFGTPR